MPKLTPPLATRAIGCAALAVLAVAGSSLAASAAAGNAPVEAAVSDVASAPAVTAAPAPAPTTFSLADLAAGTVDPEVYDAFWSGQRDQLLSAPCGHDAGAAGATEVTAFVGADERWEEQLTAALRQRREECRQGAEASAP